MKPTPSQTIGPFFRHGFDWWPGADAGVVLQGVVRDGAGEAVPDAVIELWSGTAFARALTDDDGRYRCTVDADAPYLAVSLFARGLLQRVVTRIYFDAPDDPRLASLVAERDGEGYRFDVRLQGPDQTVFLAW